MARETRKVYIQPRPSAEQAKQLAEALYSFRAAHRLTIKELAELEGFPFGSATVGKIELCADYTLATYDAVKVWLKAQPEPQPQPEQLELQPEEKPSDADNLGTLLAKISIIAEQVNDILKMQKQDHDQLMQLTPYIQNWSKIRKKLQLWRYE